MNLDEAMVQHIETPTWLNGAGNNGLVITQYVCIHENQLLCPKQWYKYSTTAQFYLISLE